MRSCAIITRPAEKAATEVHDRMPAALPRERWEEWVSPADLSAEDLVKRLLALPAPEYKLTELSTKVNNPRNDSPDVLVPR